jgi:hypothetical protein
VKGNELKKHMDALRAKQADVWLPTDVFDKIRSLTNGAAAHYNHVDPSILNVTDRRVKELKETLDAAKPVKDGVSAHFSYLDMMELEQVARYAERFLDDYGDTGVKQKELAPLTSKLEQYRKAAFPE